jgi:ferredoxin, 2Fe-2S
MAQLTLIEHNGTTHHLQAPEGQSVMQAAVDALVPGILAECGGGCSCATCHCYVDEAWVERLPQPHAMEADMLAFAIEPRANSRLSCQLLITAQTDGLVVRLPRSQV